MIHVDGLGGFGSVEAAQDHIDFVTRDNHPWLTGDLRELARLIRGKRLLPHELSQCSVCSEAFDLVLILRTLNEEIAS